MMTMTAAELIARYNLQLVPGGQIAVPGGKRLPAAVIAELKARKAEILAELERQKAEAEAKAAAEKARFEAEVAALRTGRAKIVVRWQDGEILSGWTVYGAARRVLEEARIGRDVYGWGYLVPDELVEALGQEFTLTDAVAWAEARRRPQGPSLEQIRAEKLAEAARTGQPVEVRRWTEPCADPRLECSLDIVVEWATPTGELKTERHHTH